MFVHELPDAKNLFQIIADDKTIASGVKATDNAAKQVKCYYPEYTFVEKLQTISTKVRKQQEDVDGKFETNFLRHFYDLHMLFKLDRVRNFLNTEEYLGHKRKRFRSQDNLCLKENAAFNLEQDKQLFNLYASEFNELQDLFILQQPSFNEVYDSIIAIREVG